MRIAVPLLAAVVVALSAAAPAQAKSCKTPKYGNGYYLSLSVKNTSCSTGTAVAKAFTACRHENGAKGRCTRKVKRYSCSEKRGNAIPTEYSSNVTCKKGAKRVAFAYQQNT